MKAQQYYTEAINTTYEYNRWYWADDAQTSANKKEANLYLLANATYTSSEYARKISERILFLLVRTNG